MGKKKKMLDQQPDFDGVFTGTLKAPNLLHLVLENLHETGQLDII